MSSLAWFPMFPGDYMADAFDLSPEEHGIYLLLLFRYWRSPIPNKPSRIRAISPSSDPDAVQYILERFFTLEDDGNWHNGRMREIKAEQERRSEARREAGRAGGMARVANVERERGGKKDETPETPQVTPQETPQVTPKATQQDLPIANEPEKPSRRQTVRVEDIEHVISTLNGLTGSRFEAKNPAGKLTKSGELVRERLKEYSVDELVSMVAAKHREWGSSDKMCQYLRPVTLFGREKCEMYVRQMGRAAPATRGGGWASRQTSAHVGPSPRGSATIDGEFTREESRA